MIEISRDNPRRPPDWRWQRACHLVEDLDAGDRIGYDRRRDDEWVREAARFRRDLDRCEDDVAIRTLSEDKQDLYWAHDIYQDAGSPYKEEIEARLLSRTEPSLISEKVGVSLDTVDWYERLFFNINEKLDTPAYIYHTAIGPELHRGLTEREYGKLWKYYAYMYGPAMLDSLVSQSVDVAAPSSPAEVKEAWKDDGIGSLIRKQAIAARTTPINSFTQMDLLHIWAKFVEIEQGADIATSSSNALTTNVEAFLELMPKMLVGSRVVDEVFPRIDSFDQQGHELRTHELIMMATGEEPLGLEGTLNSLHFPEESNEETEQGS